tara:strand:- start:2234 stop:2983 length:750 start_codon:yes stop_codon:yes gene_type:complete
VFAQNIVTGIVKPIYDANLSVATDGIVNKLLLQEGSVVKKNQSILKLDDKLQKLETKRRKLVLDDKIKLKSLVKNLVIMKDLLNKKEQLYKTTKAISLNELNQLRMQYINFKAEIETLRANEKKEEVEYKISAEILDYYDLRSPIDGVITEIKPQMGEWVQSGDEIVTVVNVKTCYVEVDIDSSLVKDISMDKKVLVEVVNTNNPIQKEGTFSFISAVADSSSGLVRAKVLIKNEDNTVVPGVTAKITF